MLFSSLLFLYLFLPITLLLYYVCPKSIKNYALLTLSLVFFAWGGVSFTFILIGSIIVNYIFGLLLQKYRNTKSSFLILSVGVGINILLLGVFKYTNFIVENLNFLFGNINVQSIVLPNIILPVGISFYTFHSLSYLVDIYREKTNAQKNIFHLALYICMFSQLIAGPIIRYSDVYLQLTERTHSLEKFWSGVQRFIVGLGKKVILANAFAFVADDIFSVNVFELNATTAWLGIICYTLQIYFDFSAYSDMAVGLGRMFGFDFMENFNLPYTAKSIKDFWRRWHISLSTFFRDYVYIPLGGNKKSNFRTYLNLFLVFFLTGFWHGSSWNFIVWGLFHGLFIVLERVALENVLNKIWKPFASIYTLLVVMFAWVLFRADNLTIAVQFWKALFKFKYNALQYSNALHYFSPKFILILLAGIVLSFTHFISWNITLGRWAKKSTIFSSIITFNKSFILPLVLVAILYLCSIFLISGSYNPFIYYRF